MMKLNEQQQKAVSQINGAALIISGAGTGKSTVLAAKVAAIQDYYGDEVPGILALSFTKRSTSDLAARIVNTRGVSVMNITQFFYRVLRANGYGAFKVITDEYARQALVSLSISAAQMIRRTDEMEVLTAMETGRTDNPAVKAVVVQYYNFMKQKRILDFSSIPVFTSELLNAVPSVAKKIRRQYPFVLIDEFQDLNPDQWMAVRLIWPKGSNITAIGDHRQAIYSFRGSQKGVLDKFKLFYDAKVFELSLNYRCNPSILSVANTIHPQYSSLQAVKENTGHAPVFTAAMNPEEEADTVVKQIKDRLNDGARLGDIVILYRSLPVIPCVIEALLKARIPFVKVGADANRWNHYPYKQFLELLRFVADPDIADWKQCCKYLGIDYEMLKQAQAIVKEEEGLTIQDVLMHLPMLPEEAKEKLAFISEMAARGNIKTVPLRDLIICLWDGIAREYFNADNDNILADVLNATEKFHTLADLQDEIANIKKQYAAMEKLVKNKTSDYIRVMSVHSSKGLEFDTVFLVGASEGILPDLSHDNTDLDEESNLAYVAATRAKENLYISYPRHNSKCKEEIQPSRYFARFFNKK
jgi:DNA helicase-2/ATP-dependent DNA helicase PcrA